MQQRITAPSLKSVRATLSESRQSVIVAYTLHRDEQEYSFAFPADRADAVIKPILAALAVDPQGRTTTLVVTSSGALARPDGKVAIMLETDMGPVAFQVGQTEIDILRRNLTEAETMLRQAPGHA